MKQSCMSGSFASKYSNRTKRNARQGCPDGAQTPRGLDRRRVPCKGAYMEAKEQKKPYQQGDFRLTGEAASWKAGPVIYYATNCLLTSQTATKPNPLPLARRATSPATRNGTHHTEGHRIARLQRLLDLLYLVYIANRHPID